MISRSELRFHMQEMSRGIEQIRVRLVGDPTLGSVGLVQEVAEQREASKRTVELLDKVSERLANLENFRAAQEAENKKFSESVETSKAIRNYFAAACFILPTIGGAIGWLIQTDFVKKLLS